MYSSFKRYHKVAQMADVTLLGVLYQSTVQLGPEKLTDWALNNNLRLKQTGSRFIDN